MNVDGGALYFDSLLNNEKFMRGIKEMENRVLGISSTTEKETAKMDAAFNKLSATLAGVFTIAAAKSFVTELIRVRGEFQQIEIAFTTMLKSKEKSDKLMKEAVQLAATTPFQLQEVASGAKQLLAYGFGAETVTNNLTTLGNIAAGVGAPLNDIVYLYGTLKTQGRAYSKDIQQFTGRGIPIIAELANQFNVAEDKVMGLVEAGKVGFPEVQKAFQNMTGSAGIFYNLMEEQSKSLTGQISNLEDAWDSMLNALGKDNEGLLSGGIQVAADLVQNYDKVIEILGVLIGTYGAYRTALIATSALESFQASRQVVDTIQKFNGARYVSVQVTRQLTVAEGLNAAGKRVLTSVTAAYNAVLAASPVILFTAALTGLGLVIYSLTQITNGAEEAQKKLNEAKEEGGKQADQQKNKIQDLISVLQSETATVEQKKTAYDKLNESTQGVLATYSQEEIAAGKASKTIEEYIKKIQEATAARKAFSEFQALADKMDELNRKGIGAVGAFKKLGRVVENMFSGDVKDRKSVFGIGESIEDNIVNKEKKSLSTQMDILKKAYNDKWNEIITGTPNDTKGITNTVRTVSVIDEEIKSKKEAQEATSTKKEYASIQAEINKLEAEKTAITGKLNKVEQKQSNERLKALEDISKAEKEAFRKGLTTDEEEIQATKDKYDELRKAAKEAGLGNGTITRIDRIEQKVTGGIRYDQDTEKLKASLEEQKKIYADYEAYKKDFGETKAKERFAKELEFAKDTTDKAAKEFAALTTASIFGPLTGNQQERFTVLQKDLIEQSKLKKAQQDADLLEALKASETYEIKKKEIEDRYEKLKGALLKSTPAGEYAEREKELEQNKQDEINSAKDAALEKQKVFDEFYKGIEDLSDKNAKQLVADTKEVLDELVRLGKISPELAAKIGKDLKSTGKAIDERLPQKLGELAGSLGSIANEVKNIDSGFGDMLGTLSNVVGSVGNIKSSINELKNLQSGDIWGGASAGLGIAGSVFGIVNSLTSLINKGKEQRRQEEREQIEYSNQLQLKAIEAQTKAMERQLALIKDIYGTERITKYADALVDLRKKQNESAESLNGKYVANSGDKFTDDILKRLNSGESEKKILDSLYKPADPSNVKKAYEIIKRANSGVFQQLTVDLSKPIDEIERLNKILDSGTLDETTATNVQSLINYTKQYQDTLNALKAETTGTTFSEITDSIVEMFANGNASAEDFGKNFEEIMKKSILQSFKRNTLEKALQGFYDDFAEKSKDGLNQSEVGDLQSLYNKIISNSQSQFDALQKATGIDFASTVNQTSPNSLKGAYSTASQESITLLAGQTAGMRLAQLEGNMKITEVITAIKQNNQQFDKQLLLLAGIKENTGKTADNTNRLQAIETSLKSIDNNIIKNANALAGSGKGP